MNGIPSGIVFVLWIALIVLCWIAYHKVFEVAYFNLGRGLLKEFGTCAIVSLILLALVCYLWWLAAILIAIIGFCALKKGSKGVAVLCGILVVAVIIMGITFS